MRTVLVVTGVAAAAAVAQRTIPVLAEHFRVLEFHVGRPASGAGAGVIEELADEAVALLDAAGEARAHVYGVAFGGMVAQEIGLRHPDRVHALVLGATSAGGKSRVPPDGATQAFLHRRMSMPAEEGLWASIPYSYSITTRRHHAQRIGEDLAGQLHAPPVPRGVHQVQRHAALVYDGVDGLRGLAVPTLIVHGEEDRIVPVANAVALEQIVPGATTILLEGAGHAYATDAPEADRRITSFLLDQQAKRSSKRVSRPPAA